MSDRDGNGILWFLLGTGVGVAAGLLFAPQSGNETREVIMAKADEGREFVRKRAQEAKEQELANRLIEKKPVRKRAAKEFVSLIRS
jgi:gas vesicle protein